MKRRKNLERAVVLGLLLSTSIYGSAWAESLNESEILNDNANIGAWNPIYGINGDEYHVKWLESYYNSEKIFDEINVTVKTNYYVLGGTTGDQAIGISTRDNTLLGSWKPNVILNSYGDINVEVQTRNAQDAYGLLADDNGKELVLKSENGDIKINASKAKGKKVGDTLLDPNGVNYENAEVHAIAAENNGTANLTAQNGNVIITAGYDITGANAIETEKLQQGNIYGIGNSESNLVLNAGGTDANKGTVQITATAHSGNAYGLDSWSGKQNNITAANNLVVSAASATGEAYAVKVIGGENNNFTGANNSFTAESTNEKTYALFAQEGAVVNITAENITDNVLDNSFTSDGGTAVQVENSKLTVTGDTLMSGTENGLVVKKDTNTLANGNEEYDVVIKGDLYAQAQNGYSSQLMAGTKLLVEGDKVINNTMFIEENAEGTVNGNLVTANSDTGEYVTVNGNAVELKNNAELTVGGNVNISATGTGINITSGTVNINNNTGVNYISGDNIGVNAVEGSIFNAKSDTKIVGSDAGLVLSGVNASTSDKKQSTITGSLDATATNGTAVKITSANSEVTGNEYIKGNIGLELDKANQTVGGSIIGTATDTAIKATDSILNVGGNIFVSGDNIGAVADSSTITVTGQNGVGFNLISGGNIGFDVKGNSNITFNGGTVIYATDESSMGLNVADSDFTSNGANIISADRNAVKAENSTINLNAGNDYNIIVAGANVDGNQPYYDGTAVNATNTTNGTGADGSIVNILGAGNKIYGTVRANGSDTIVNIGGAVDADGKLSSGADNWITSSALGVSEDNKGVVAAVYAQNQATVNIKAGDGQTNYIIAQAERRSDGTYNERAIWAQGGSEVNIEGQTTIIASTAEISTGEIALGDLENNEDRLGIAIAAGTGEVSGYTSADDLLEAIPDDIGSSTVSLNYSGDSLIYGDVVSAWNGNVNITANGNGSKLKFYGNALAGNGGTLSLDLGEGGVWYGRADDYGDAGAYNETTNKYNGFYDPAFSNDILLGGAVNLTMGDKSKWYVQGQSWITSITSNGDTLIDLVSANTDRNSTAHALTIGKLTGDTTFNMSLNVNRDYSDMLYIKEADGSYKITLHDPINTDLISADGLRFATVGKGSNAEFSVENRDSGAFNTVYNVISEEYTSDDPENDSYNSVSSDDGNGSLEKPGSESVDNFFTAETTDEGTSRMRTAAVNDIMLLDADDTAANSADNTLDATTNFLIDSTASRSLSDAGKTMLNMSRANYSNAIYMDRLNKRLGEARYINGEENEGMWVRIRHDRIGKTDAYRSQNTMYELGYDVKQECDNGERRVGFAVDYMHGDTGYSDVAGKGELDRYGLWLYDTWMGDKGHYVDYVAKWGHLDNDFEVYTMSEGKKVTGDYSNNVFSVSAEYGRKKDIGSDWYFEPQAQLQLARVTGAEYTTSQGTKVSVDGINSLIGRAGFRIGKDFGEQKQSTVYIKADVLHEFLGDQDVSVMDDTTNGRYVGIGYENEGTWYDIGFGFATQTGKNSYAFMDFEKSFGHDNDETYQINAGVQWTF